MEEIEEWFLEEFGHLGFTISPTVYNPYDFTPKKIIRYNGFNTRLFINPDVTTRLTYLTLPGNVNPIVEYKEFLKEEIYRFLLIEEMGYTMEDCYNITDNEWEYFKMSSNGIKLKKYLPKFKFTIYSK